MRAGKGNGREHVKVASLNHDRTEVRLGIDVVLGPLDDESGDDNLDDDEGGGGAVRTDRAGRSASGRAGLADKACVA